MLIFIFNFFSSFSFFLSSDSKTTSRAILRQADWQISGLRTRYKGNKRIFNRVCARKKNTTHPLITNHHFFFFGLVFRAPCTPLTKALCTLKDSPTTERLRTHSFGWETAHVQVQRAPSYPTPRSTLAGI